jgi:predicted ATP-dependent endonuclease of OLD family
MTLKSFAVNNFRGISGGLEKNKILFEGTNSIFVFGQNNTGKSSILRAYEAFYKDSINANTDFNYIDNSSDIEIEVEVYITEDEDKSTIDDKAPNKWDNLVSNYTDDNGIMKIRKVFKRSDSGKKAANFTWKQENGSAQFEEVAYGGIGLHPVFQSLMLKPLYIKAMPTESDVESIVNEVLKEVATSRLSKADSEKLKKAQKIIDELQNDIYKPEDIATYKENVNKQFSEMFTGFTVDIDDGKSKAKFTHDKIGKEFKVSFNYKITHDTIEPNTYEQVGHGSVRVAIFLLMLMRDKLRGEEEARKNFIVLFEEPELFLHPILTKKLRSLIYDVSDTDTPFQLLCASHSPQMIDVSKEHASLVRMIKTDDNKTQVFQIRYSDLENDEPDSLNNVKEKIYEILRFDPYICESFYADEVLLVEGDTEAIILRGFQQEFENLKDVFVVNCHTCNNIPFYQRFFSKFNIPYNIICDTDSNTGCDKGWNSDCDNPTFTGGIQKSIYNQFEADKTTGVAKNFFVFDTTFESHHAKLDEPFKFVDINSGSKPVEANNYWKKIVTKKTMTVLKKFQLLSTLKN